MNGEWILSRKRYFGSSYGMLPDLWGGRMIMISYIGRLVCCSTVSCGHRVKGRMTNVRSDRTFFTITSVEQE